MGSGRASATREGPLGLRRPRLVLAFGAVLLLVLAFVGLGVDGKLRPSAVAVPGTSSARADRLVAKHFGDSAPFVILLRGPGAALDRQGPALVRALRSHGRVSTLSPWDDGSLERLRPSARQALILVDFHTSAERAVAETVDYLDRFLGEAIRPPVAATQTGFATLSRAIQQESVRSTRVAELIALPFLLVVLLLVFRSPAAAAIPLAFGVAAVVGTRGVLALVAGDLAIDGFALTVATMMGLALGVDYSLLMVSRFREELGAGANPRRAATRTRRTAGRTAVFAGATLFLAMAVTLLVMPGSLFLSLAGTAILVTAISVAIAFFLAPPLLMLLGPNVDRWRIGPKREGVRLMVLVGAALRRPRLAAGVIGGVLILLALPALGLKTGPPSAAQLPSSNAARKDARLLARTIGAGWDAPFVLIAATDRGPVTATPRLRALRRAQRQIDADPGVQAVIGPGQIQRRIAPLRRGGNDLLAGRGEGSPTRLARLGDRLHRASGGVGQIRGGLDQAAAGAGLLSAGSGRASEGAAQISAGLGRAAAGAGEATEALDRLEEGSGELAEGQRRAALGARSLRDELKGLMPVLRRAALARARRLRASLRLALASNPELAPQVHEAELLVEGVALARNQARRARVSSTRLHSGQVRLAKGGTRLHRGADRLSEAAESLPAGLTKLGIGAAELADGIQRLTGGADALSSNLAAGSRASRPLEEGLRRASVRVSSSAEELTGDLDALRRSSPGIFDSGSFVLSALEGEPREERERAGQVVDLEHGGQAAKLLVIPRYTFNTPGSDAVGDRLRDVAAALAQSSGMETGVTGGPAQLSDYSEAIASRVPLVVVTITLITFLILVLILRAVPLAAIAVGLNLLTVAVAFGVLTLLFDLPAGWPLGGRSYVDAIGAAGIFGIIFGLSIDYAVFLLTRVRERHDAGAESREAITFGLARTARVITGAAAVMIAVFVAFAAAPIATVSQLGTGLTVAVVIDATVVRIVLLPALMLMLGERVWWFPRSLKRNVPRRGLRGA